MMNVSVIFWEKWIYQKLYEISYILLPGAHWWIGEYFVPWPSVKIRPLNWREPPHLSSLNWNRVPFKLFIMSRISFKELPELSWQGVRPAFLGDGKSLSKCKILDNTIKQSMKEENEN